MLHVHRSERADALVAPLAAVLAQPPEDPFAPDVVAVPTRGVERWLAQRLSHVLGAADDVGGICANVSFASPASLVAAAVSDVLGLDRDADPWAAERLTWPLLDVIDAAAGEPWAMPLDRYLGAADGDEVRRSRRLGLARRLAGLFTAYGAQRPSMIRAWAAGRPEDGGGTPVPDDLAWQVELWHRLRAMVDTPSPAERLTDALAAIIAHPDAVDLPARLSVFGPTRLPEDELQMLDALAVHREVHLWLAHPSPALWDAIAATPPASVRRRDQERRAAHPLLASLGRDAAELQARLTALGSRTDVHHPAPPPAPTLLGVLQRGLRADEPAGEPHRIQPDDRSVQVHACHGRARQVEVLREVLVGLFADDPTLEPRDVLVMCPDVEAFAPLISAAFGNGPGDETAAVHPGQTLRVRLADRSPRQTNPFLALLAMLLELADGRVTASDVLDLAASAPVRRRFVLDDDDLARIRDWTVAAGARWGENVDRHARFGLPQVRQGTWDMALDRILLGAAMAEEDHRFVGPALPLDDVDSTDIELAGRLAELLDRLTGILADLDGVRPVASWLEALDRALTLLAAAAPGEEWQEVHARAVLADVRTTSAGRDTAELRLGDVRALLADRLRGRPTRAGFRTGALTICSLEPMRAVPHRVICLLGLDDGAFPRAARHDGDDILLRDPCVGERDRRSEDRQILLDAVSAVTDNLVILYAGADDRTGSPRPPAVPVGELLDALDAAARTAGGGPARGHVVVRHPLQNVDERNFTAGALGRPGPLSFDAVAHRAARAGRGQREEPAPFLTEPLPAEPESGLLDLDDLIAALEHPVRWFLRHRLGLSLPGDVDDVEDRLPLALDPLESWQVGDRLLAAALAGVEPNHALAAEWRRGEVPPRELGRATLLDVRGKVEPVAAAARLHAVGEPRAVDVAVTLPDGRLLSGTVADVHGTAVVRAVYSRLGPKHRLRAWVQLLALAATHPSTGWSAATIGRGPGRRATAAVATLRTPADATARLAELVTLRDLARAEPLPMPVTTACAYATNRRGGNTVEQALYEAGQVWRSSFECKDDHHTLCWGEGVALHEILGDPTDLEAAWAPQDPSRFGVLARRVWDPLLDHEETGTA